MAFSAQERGWDGNGAALISNSITRTMSLRRPLTMSPPPFPRPPVPSPAPQQGPRGDCYSRCSLHRCPRGLGPGRKKLAGTARPHNALSLSSPGPDTKINAEPGPLTRHRHRQRFPLNSPGGGGGTTPGAVFKF